MDRIKIGLWGTNGHQIHGQIVKYPQLELIAVGQYPDATVQKIRQQTQDLVVCDSYEQMIDLPGIQMVSLCPEYRNDQVQKILVALARGIHVYAEKPAATNEADLDRIIAAAQASKATFHEMGGTVFDQPYWEMKRIVAQGTIGQVVQVLAQKSYPMHEGRPTTERVDGGLVEQSGVHAMRFVEQVSGLQAVSVAAMQTGLGETRPDSDLQVACHITGKLSNGGLYTIIANYLNPTGFGSWGNEMVRVFGTKGMIESTDGGTRTHLVVGDKDHCALDTTTPAPDWLSLVLADVLGQGGIPLELQDELHPTRMVVQARACVQQA